MHTFHGVSVLCAIAAALSSAAAAASCASTDALFESNGGGLTAHSGGAGAGAGGEAGTTTTTTTTTGGGGSGAGAGAGGAGATGAGGAGASGGSGGTGGGPHVTENCLNGFDDNGDLLVDCADPDCIDAGYRCVPRDIGANAYIALVPSAATCLSPATVTSLTACGACACQAGAGACSLSMTAFDGTSCQGVGGSVYSPECWYQNLANTALSFTATTAPLSGSCLPQSSQVPASSTVACSVTQPGGCPGNDACVPPSFTGVDTCVLLDAGAPCPNDYAHGSPVNVGGTTCACGCNLTQTTCHAPQIQVSYSDFNCLYLSQLLTVGPSCTNGGFVESFMVPDSVSADVTCSASGAVLNPSASGKLCCQW